LPHTPQQSSHQQSQQPSHQQSHQQPQQPSQRQSHQQSKQRVDRLLAELSVAKSKGTAGPRFSVELWPARTEKAAQRLEQVLDELACLEPLFVSITYGAAGSTRERTHELVLRLLQQGRHVPIAHLACLGHSEEELREILRAYREAGLVNLLALRGDPPLNATDAPAAGELAHAIDLVRLARREGPFCIAVAAHPERHPEAADLESDRRHLAEKMELADFGISQFFFRAEHYFELLEDLRSRGIEKPVLPGIMAVTRAKQLEKMAQLAGTEIPPAVREKVEQLAEDPVGLADYGVELACQLGQELLEAGACVLHLYTMNDPSSTVRIVENLGLSP